jgi:preprotein translocase subunit SecD
LIVIVVIAFGALAAVLATHTEPQLGLDLQGGASVVLQPPKGTDTKALDTAIEIIRSRVDALGVAEPDITRQGDTVLVELPGVKDQQRALDIVGQTAELRFRPVLNVLAPEGATTTTTTAKATTTTTAKDGSTTTTAAGATTTAAPGTTAASTTSTTVGSTTTTTVLKSNTRDNDKADTTVILPDKNEKVRYLLGPTTVLGKAVSTAAAEFDQVQWTVHLEMTSAGINGFNAIAAECFNKQQTCPTGQLAITLDAQVVSAPTIQTPTFQRDRIQISGSFKEKEAKDLALVLRYGSLPVQLKRQDAQTVSASLGKDSLRAGLIAGAVGTILVLLYMTFYYRLLGIVVLAGLGVWGSLQWSIISYLGKTQGLALSLAGVTGIVVSIGVTVDSYVVFFERLKDEIRRGSTIRTAVERGFRHAFRTILIADTSAFIGAATLYLLTVGPVRGFAFFLGLSTLLDVTVAWFFTRPLVALLSRRKRFSAGSFIGTAAPASPALVGGGS